MCYPKALYVALFRKPLRQPGKAQTPESLEALTPGPLGVLAAWYEAQSILSSGLISLYLVTLGRSTLGVLYSQGYPKMIRPWSVIRNKIEISSTDVQQQAPFWRSLVHEQG